MTEELNTKTQEVNDDGQKIERLLEGELKKLRDLQTRNNQLTLQLGNSILLYDNASNQLRNLEAEVDQLKQDLTKHREDLTQYYNHVIESHGLVSGDINLDDGTIAYPSKKQL